MNKTQRKIGQSTGLIKTFSMLGLGLIKKYILVWAPQSTVETLGKLEILDTAPGGRLHNGGGGATVGHTTTNTNITQTY